MSPKGGTQLRGSLTFPACCLDGLVLGKFGMTKLGLEIAHLRRCLGQGSFHPRPRRAFPTMWGGPDLRYHQPRGHATPTLAQIRGRAVPDGARLGDFEDVFPVGWRAPAAAPAE